MLTYFKIQTMLHFSIMMLVFSVTKCKMICFVKCVKKLVVWQQILVCLSNENFVSLTEFYAVKIITLLICCCRILISYVRQEAVNFAVELKKMLTECGYSVFLVWLLTQFTRRVTTKNWNFV